MSRTDQQRYDEALAHVKSINLQLGNEIDTKLKPQSVKIGAELSLGGSGYWNAGTPKQHTAVRGLILCHIAYFRPPHANMDFASPIALKSIRSDCLNKNETQINEEISDFVQGSNLTHDALARAAESAHDLTGVVDNFRRSRKDKNVSPKPVCYHGVVTWLFVSGFISKRWLAKEGNTLNAYSANKFLGAGVDVPPDQWDGIQRGYLWNIQRKGDPSTCHWGVSLGADRAAACNNTDESPTKKLVYESGNTFYGVFPFSEICQVLNLNDKYGYTPDKDGQINIVVKKIDPTSNASYY